MADDATIVGRLAVKVLPDTSDFTRELKRDLERIERGLKVEVRVKADTAGLRAQVNEAVREANRAAGDVKIDVEVDGKGEVARTAAWVRAQLAGIKAPPIELKFSEEGRARLSRRLAEMDALVEKHEELVRAQRRLEKSDAVTFGKDFLLPDQYARAAREVERLRREIERTSVDVSAKIGVDLNRENLSQVRHSLQELVDDFDRREVELIPDTSTAMARWVSARLSWLSRERIAKITPVLDSGAAARVATTLAALSGGRLVSSTFDNLWDLVKNMDKNIPIIGSVAAAVMGLGASALASSSNLFALSRSLAQIAPAALLLPGILGGFAAGLGLTIAVMKDFNRVLPGVGRQLGVLQDQLSGVFWARAAAPIEDAFSSILESARSSMLGASSALGTFFSSLAQSAKRHLGGSLPGMFDNLSTSILVASRGTEDWLRVVEVLGRRGSEYLPRMAAWANRVGASWASWLDEADRTGRLNEMVEVGIANLGHLWRVLAEGGGILADIARAADRAGGTNLESLARGLDRVHEATSRASFQRGLTAVFESAHDAMMRVAEVSGPRVYAFFANLETVLTRGLPDVGSIIGEMVGGIAEALSTEKFTAGFLEFLRGLRAGVESLTPVWARLGDGLGAVASLAGSLARAFGPVLGEALRLASAAAERLGPVIAGVASELGGRMVAALRTVGPAAIALAEAFARVVSSVVRVPGLLESLVVGFAAVKAAMAVQAVAAAWNAGMAGLATAMGAVSRVAPAAAAGLTTAGTAAKGFVASLGPAAAAIAGVQLAMEGLASVTFVPEIGADRLAREMLALKDGTAEASGEVSRFFSATLVAKGNTESWSGALDDLGRTMKAALADDLWSQFGRWSTIGTDELRKFTEQASQMDAALMRMVETGDEVAATEMWNDIKRQAQESGVSVEKLSAAFPMMSNHVESAAMSARRLAEDQARAAESAMGLAEGTVQAGHNLDVYAAAAAQVNGVTPALIGGVNDASKAFIDFSQGLDAQNFSLDGWLSELEASAAAMQEWGNNMSVIMQHANADVVAELQALGPAGATAVSELANQIGSGDMSGLDRLTEVTRMKGEGAVAGMDSELRRMGDVVNMNFAHAAAAADGSFTQIEARAIFAGADLVNGIGRGMYQQIPTLSSDVATVQAALAGDLGALATLGGPEGAEIVNNVATALSAGSGQVGAAAAGLGSAANSALQGSLVAVRTTGWSFANDFAEPMYMAAPSAGAAGSGLGLAAVGGMNAQRPAAGGAGDGMAFSFRDRIYQGVTGAGAAGTANSNAAGVGFGTAKGTAGNAGSTMGSTFVNRIGSHSGQAQATGSNVAGSGGRGLGMKLSMAGVAGSSMGSGFVSGISNHQGGAHSAGSGLGRAGASGASGSRGQFQSAGSNAGSGFAAGIRSMWGAVMGTARSLANAAAQTIRSALNIHSPSRVFAEIGAFTGEGFAVGLEESERSVVSAAERLAEAAQRGAAGVRLSPLVDAAGGVADPRAWREGAGAAGASVVINGVPMDHAETTAREVQWAMRRLDRGGKYARRAV